jgi:N-acetylmuramoyl-L-alanine amidase
MEPETVRMPFSPLSSSDSRDQAKGEMRKICVRALVTLVLCSLVPGVDLSASSGSRSGSVTLGKRDEDRFTEIRRKMTGPAAGADESAISERVSTEAGLEEENVLIPLGTRRQQALVNALRDASEEYDVPFRILAGIAWVTSGWSHRVPSQTSDMPGTYGVMGLHDDPWFGHSLHEAARLISRTPEDLSRDQALNVRGAAALLRHLRRQSSQDGVALNESLGEWEPALRLYSGIPQREVADLFVSAVARAIGRIEIRDGAFEFNPVPLGDTGAANLRIPLPDLAACSGAAWMGGVPTSNYTVGRAGTPISMIVIHTTEGTAASALSWFQSTSSLASAHYIVGRDGAVWQAVADADTAYHAGNYSYNQKAVGIELEGWADGVGGDFSWQTSAQWTSVTALVGCLSTTYSVARDRAHLIGHNQVPDPYVAAAWGGAGHHYDPGAYWNWARFMSGLGAGTQPRFGSVPSQCSVLVLPQAGAPSPTSIWPGQGIIAFESVGAYTRVELSGYEAAQTVSPTLARGQYHWDGWVNTSCLGFGSTGTQTQVIGVFPSRLRLRDGTQSTSNVLATASEGKQVAGTGATAIGYDGSTWYELYLTSDVGATRAWASGAYLTVSGGVTACTGYLINPGSANPSAAVGSTLVTVTGSPAGCTVGTWNAAQAAEAVGARRA